MPTRRCLRWHCCRLRGQKPRRLERLLCRRALRRARNGVLTLLVLVLLRKGRWCLRSSSS